MTAHKARYQTLAMGYCLLLGAVLLLNIHPVGDGLWFWYGRLTREHQLLYTDLHFPLQPLFVLLTGWFQAVFGLGWLESKILPALQLAGYVIMLRLIARHAPVGDAARALLIAGVFSLTIASPFYRFDDYHITSDLLSALAVYLLLRVGAARGTGAVLATAAVVGACCGLCLANRLNDGGTLLVGCSIGLAFLAPRARSLAVLTQLAVAPTVLLAIVLLTHDTVRAWATESIVRAAAIKGGTGNVLVYPLTLPWHLVQGMVGWRAAFLLVYLATFAGAARFLAQQRAQARGQRFWSAQSVTAVVVAAACLGIFLWQSRAGTAVYFFTLCATLLAYIADLIVVVRSARSLAGAPPRGWAAREVLLLIPFGQLIAGAMTSAYTLPDLFPPLAFTLLLLPVALRADRVKPLAPWLCGIFAGVVLGVGVSKTVHPYFWHFYNSAPLFRQREWYQHPLYGPMYVESAQLQLTQPICASIKGSPSPHTLLSLPYPYPNYFCGVQPWKGYVQTWYDTASRETIETLAAQLRVDPPEWITYQHDERVLRVHETTFNGGRPLAHRQLESLVRDRLATGAWTLVQRSCLDRSDWLLIRTAPTTAPTAAQQSYIRAEYGYCDKGDAKAP